MSGHIYGGKATKIEEFPHSAFLSILCNSERGDGFFACGSSIINQAILLTAGHCVYECKIMNYATATVGHGMKENGTVIEVLRFKVHEKLIEGFLSNDIALVSLKFDLKFSETVKRVVLLKNRPVVNTAYIAGWGMDRENLEELSPTLKYTRQQILSSVTCEFLMNNPAGTLCAESGKIGIPSNADSGSGLMVKDYIQIGLVSYVNPHISKGIIVYTDIGYFYDWIQAKSKEIYCDDTNEGIIRVYRHKKNIIIQD